ncbi:hypothetical protein ATK36_6282 [Amycolatopsis sulphurea]|uniref:Uncharacterized protein n=1 Tax=Amycolatopsis sulphurea TaxID=76022 RepID=A0A2A9FKP9_9PSEU|nr:hypothetical protein [Amycolatopsis sulphurea]PFG51015.1 hypothetical protein ATK36_6282 [Amycolatopsis sulphurea]
MPDDAAGKLRRAADAGEVPPRSAASIAACLDALAVRLPESGDSGDTGAGE